MSKRLKKHADYLSVLCRCSTGERRALLKSARPDLIKAICEISHNTLQGNVKLKDRQRKKLQRHKNTLRRLADRSQSLIGKRRLLVQQGGFLPALIAPIASIIGGLISSLV